MTFAYSSLGPIEKQSMNVIFSEMVSHIEIVKISSRLSFQSLQKKKEKEQYRNWNEVSISIPKLCTYIKCSIIVLETSKMKSLCMSRCDTRKVKSVLNSYVFFFILCGKSVI